MRLAEFAALMQRTEGAEITSYLVADPRAAKQRLFFGQTQNPASAHNLEDLGWRLLYTEVDWVRTT
jgi:hypothetical protein